MCIAESNRKLTSKHTSMEESAACLVLYSNCEYSNLRKFILFIAFNRSLLHPQIVYRRSNIHTYSHTEEPSSSFIFCEYSFSKIDGDTNNHENEKRTQPYIVCTAQHESWWFGSVWLASWVDASVICMHFPF